MHFMHADFPINLIKFDQIYSNYSSNHSSNKLLETNFESYDVQKYSPIVQNQDKIYDHKNVDYKPLLNQHQHRTKNRRKDIDFIQSNKKYSKKLKIFKKRNSDNKFMTGNDLSLHQVFIGMYKDSAGTTGKSRQIVERKKKSNYIDDRLSRIDEVDLKKRTNKRNTGSLTNLFYQYTALMQSQLLTIPALFMSNNSELLPRIPLSHDSKLTNSPSNNLSNSSLKNNPLGYQTSSIYSREPEAAFLTSSSNQSAYEPFFYSNVSDAYRDYNQDNINLKSINSSNFTLLPSTEPLNLNLLFTILISLLMVICILVTAIGNLFVIAAILRDRVLRNVQNYLVLSLAFADLMVSLLVMPLAAVYEIQGHWTLGVILCDIWTWADVLCCTASILHLLAIAIDRYWAVTSVEYMRSRNAVKILSLIALVWFVALLVSVGPLFGWKDSNFEKRLNEEGVCLYSQDLSYQLFATVSTFYAPLIFILLLYWRIFQTNYWLEKQGTNEENFIKEIVFYSFDKEYFYSHVSFKRDHDKVSLADSNILRCWIYIVGKKFGERIVLQKISSIFENLSDDTSENQLLQSAVAKEATVAVSHKSCEIIKHFPISRAIVYDAVEVLFLNEDNINIIAGIWTNICQNKIQLFIEAMILKTFSEDFFLFDITWKKGERKVQKNGQIKGDIKEGELKKLIDGSNIFKCWQVTIEKKFPSHKVTEDELKKYFRVLKNTLGKNKN